MVGEVLEWMSGAALVLAIFLFFGLAAFVAAAGVFLFYEAQCHSDTPIKLPTRFKRKAQDQTE